MEGALKKPWVMWIIRGATEKAMGYVDKQGVMEKAMGYADKRGVMEKAMDYVDKRGAMEKSMDRWQRVSLSTDFSTAPENRRRLPTKSTATATTTKNNNRNSWCYSS